MKKVLLIVLIGIAFISCSSHPNNLIISTYSPKVYSLSKGKDIKKIYIKSVADLRENPALVGSFEKDKKLYAVMSHTRVATWIYDGLEKALEKRGYKMVQRPLKEALRVQVAISDLNVDYRNIKNADNTFGKLVLALSLDRGSNIKQQTIKISRQAYNSSIPSKKEYEVYIYEMLDDAMDKILKQITKLHEVYSL